MTIIMSTLVEMTPAEARRYGVPESERERYLKLIADPAFAPHEPPRWFRLVYVDLNDGGDLVPVAERWTPRAHKRADKKLHGAGATR
jgi:hypothetical protein